MMEQVINELTYFIWLQTKLWIQMMANYSNILKNEWFEMNWNEPYSVNFITHWILMVKLLASSQN